MQANLILTKGHNRETIAKNKHKSIAHSRMRGIYENDTCNNKTGINNLYICIDRLKKQI